MNKILEVLKAENKPMNIREIALKTSMKQVDVLRIINRSSRKIIKPVVIDGGLSYQLR